jgi:hypothetical protein
MGDGKFFGGHKKKITIESLLEHEKKPHLSHIIVLRG